MLFLAAKMCEAVRLKALERMVDMLSRDRAGLHLPRIICSNLLPSGMPRWYIM